MKSMRVRASHWKLVLPVALACLVAVAMTAAATQAGTNTKGPKFTEAAAFDISKPLRELVKGQKPAAKSLPPATGKDTDSELSAEVAASGAVRTGCEHQRCDDTPSSERAPVAADRSRDDGELRGPEQPGQLQRLRLPGQPAGSGGRRRPEPLRRDDQPRLRRLLQDRHVAARPVDTGTLWAGFAGRGLHRSLGRPDRGLRPARRPLDPHPVHDARPGRSDDLPVLQLRRDLARPATRPAPTSATRSPTGDASTSPTTRSTASGRTRTSSRPASSDRPSSTASASTGSRGTR